jgi:predicted RNA-binding protein with PIN domain
MALHYILDGYNIIKQIENAVPHLLESERENLIHLIELYRPQGSLRNSVTIVFDGRSGVISRLEPSVVKTIFTPTGESADDRIKRMVAEAKNKKCLVVVTDDRDIQYTVRPLGAAVVSVGEFLSRIKPKPVSSSPGRTKRQQKEKGLPRGPHHVSWREASEAEGKYIPKTLEDQITSELERLWGKDDDQKKNGAS